MKKIMFTICFILGLVIMAAPALAVPFNVNDTITYALSNSVLAPGYGYGGLFTITDNITHVSIQTFCLEINEHIYNGDRVASISDSAVNGGRGGGQPDQISSATDWLYAQYIHNKAAYNPAALQVAFWVLEDEVNNTEYTSWFSAELRAAVDGYVANARQHNTGSYGTKVLNLKAATSEDPHQSHLIYVPEPGILILLGIALSTVGLASRRYKF